jgi:hypothetical protein
MARRKQHRMFQSEDAWSLEHLGKIFYEVFMLPLYRLPKYGIYLKSDAPKCNIILDCFALSLDCVVIGMLHFWYGLITIGGILLISFMIGYIRRRNIRENLKQPEIAPEYKEKLAQNGYYKFEPDLKFNEVEPIKARVEKEFKTERMKRTPKPKTTKTAIPDFDENDTVEWSKWIRDNPDMIFSKKHTKN